MTAEFWKGKWKNLCFSFLIFTSILKIYLTWNGIYEWYMMFGVLILEFFSYLEQFLYMVYNTQSLLWERKNILPRTVSMYCV